MLGILITKNIFNLLLLVIVSNVFE